MSLVGLVSVGSVWRGSGHHAHELLEVVRVTNLSVKVQPIRGRRHNGSRIWTVRIDKFVKTHNLA